MFVFLISFIPLITIHLWQYKISGDPGVKDKALGLGIMFLLGFGGAIFDFLLGETLKLPAISSDIALGGMAIVMLAVVIFTQKGPNSSPNKKAPTL